MSRYETPGLSVVDLAGIRARFEATLRVTGDENPIRSLLVSSDDVPLLVAEVERLALRYADLVAACRAGLVADMDGEAGAWAYVADELPPPPAGHRLWQRAAEQGTTPPTGWPGGAAGGGLR